MKKLRKNVFATKEVPFFEIPVKWEMQDVLTIQANNLKEAFDFVNTLEYDLPIGEYVEGTYEIDYDRLEE